MLFGLYFLQGKYDLSQNKSVEDLVQRAVDETQKYAPTVTQSEEFQKYIACADYNR